MLYWVMIKMFFVLLSGCSMISQITKKILPRSQETESAQQNPMIINPVPSKTLQFSGQIVDGWYIDSQNELKVPIGDGTFEVGQIDSNRKLYTIYPTFTIEYWYFETVILQPVARQNCTWDFFDQGLYQKNVVHDISVIGTCFPKSENDYIIFGYFNYINGGTWQIEVRVPIDKMIEGKKDAEQILSQLLINDVYVWQSLQE